MTMTFFMAGSVGRESAAVCTKGRGDATEALNG